MFLIVNNNYWDSGYEKDTAERGKAEWKKSTLKRKGRQNQKARRTNNKNDDKMGVLVNK